MTAETAHVPPCGGLEAVVPPQTLSRCWANVARQLGADGRKARAGRRTRLMRFDQVRVDDAHTAARRAGAGIRDDVVDARRPARRSRPRFGKPESAAVRVLPGDDVVPPRARSKGSSKRHDLALGEEAREALHPRSATSQPPDGDEDRTMNQPSTRSRTKQGGPRRARADGVEARAHRLPRRPRARPAVRVARRGPTQSGRPSVHRLAHGREGPSTPPARALRGRTRSVCPLRPQPRPPPPEKGKEPRQMPTARVSTRPRPRPPPRAAWTGKESPGPAADAPQGARGWSAGPAEGGRRPSPGVRPPAARPRRHWPPLP